MSIESAAKGEGGAGRRGPRGPAGLRLSRDASGAMLLEKAPLGLSKPQVRHFSSVARAVFEALFWAAPGGLTFQALSFAGLRSLSTAAGTCRRNRGWVPQKRRLPWSPATRVSARRDRAASAASARVCVLHPSETTAPDPHSKTPLEAPLVDRGAGIVPQVFRVGINLFGEVIPARMSRRAAWLAKLGDRS